MNTNQIHFNVPYAEGTQFGKPLVNSAFTLALVLGLTVPDTSENAAANLGWGDITLPSPVFVGDTLWAESEITERRESRSNPSVGIVSMRCRGINQRREVVIEFTRTFMVYKRSAPEVAQHVPRHRRGLEGLMHDRRADDSPAGRAGSTLDDVPAGGRRAREAPRARHARLRAGRARRRGRRRGPGDDGGARRRAAGDGDRARTSDCRRANAAFANAMLCHGLDFDDTHSDSVSHVSTVIAARPRSPPPRLSGPRAGTRSLARSSPATRS